MPPHGSSRGSVSNEELGSTIPSDKDKPVPASELYHLQDTRWQVVAMRAICDGKLEEFVAEATLHPEAIHDKFTKQMHQWEVEWESAMWYELLETTALYIASSYAQPEIIKWLLDNGADPGTPCFANLRARDVIGQCCSRSEEDRSEPLKTRMAQVKSLLQLPRQVLKPPRQPDCEVKADYVDIFVLETQLVPSELPDTPPQQVSRRVKKRVLQAKVVVEWKSYWMPPGTCFDLRRRASGAQDWTYERCQAAHRTLEGLPLQTTYDFQARAQNETGWSGWSPVATITTPDRSTR